MMWTCAYGPFVIRVHFHERRMPLARLIRFDDHPAILDTQPLSARASSHRMQVIREQFRSQESSCISLPTSGGRQLGNLSSTDVMSRMSPLPTSSSRLSPNWRSRTAPLGLNSLL